MNLMQISFTSMKTQDIPVVGRIERESHLEPWSESAFARELTLPHSSVVIARMIPSPALPACRFHGGRRRFGAGAGNGPTDVVVGYLCSWLVAGELQVHNITVATRFRSRGIGRRLLHQVLRDASSRKAELAVLEVRKSNLPALRLYERTGFVVVGERRDYYTIQPEPAILMEKKLP